MVFKPLFRIPISDRFSRPAEVRTSGEILGITFVLNLIVLRLGKKSDIPFETYPRISEDKQVT